MKMDKGIIFLGIGFELVAMCVGGVFFGQMIDHKMGWQNAATVSLILLLLVGWFFHLFLLIRKFERDDEPKP